MIMSWGWLMLKRTYAKWHRTPYRHAPSSMKTWHNSVLKTCSDRAEELPERKVLDESYSGGTGRNSAWPWAKWHRLPKGQAPFNENSRHKFVLNKGLLLLLLRSVVFAAPLFDGVPLDDDWAAAPAVPDSCDALPIFSLLFSLSVMRFGKKVLRPDESAPSGVELNEDEEYRSCQIVTMKRKKTSSSSWIIELSWIITNQWCIVAMMMLVFRWIYD